MASSLGSTAGLVKTTTAGPSGADANVLIGGAKFTNPFRPGDTTLGPDTHDVHYRVLYQYKLDEGSTQVTKQSDCSVESAVVLSCPVVTMSEGDAAMWVQYAILQKGASPSLDEWKTIAADPPLGYYVTYVRGVAKRLGILQQAASAVGGQAFGVQPKVALIDGGGDVVTDDSSTIITVQLRYESERAVAGGLSGYGDSEGLSVRLQNGIAEFTGIGAAAGMTGPGFRLAFVTSEYTVVGSRFTIWQAAGDAGSGGTGGADDADDASGSDSGDDAGPGTGGGDVVCTVFDSSGTCCDEGDVVDECGVCGGGGTSCGATAVLPLDVGEDVAEEVVDPATGSVRDQFEEDFRNDVAKTLGVHPDDIVINGITPGTGGSLVDVDFTIRPPAPSDSSSNSTDSSGPGSPTQNSTAGCESGGSGGGIPWTDSRTVSEIQQQLQDALDKPNSRLRNGTLTSKVPPATGVQVLPQGVCDNGVCEVGEDYLMCEADCLSAVPPGARQPDAPSNITYEEVAADPTTPDSGNTTCTPTIITEVVTVTEPAVPGDTYVHNGVFFKPVVYDDSAAGEFTGFTLWLVEVGATILTALHDFLLLFVSMTTPAPNAAAKLAFGAASRGSAAVIQGGLLELSAWDVLEVGQFVVVSSMVNVTMSPLFSEFARPFVPSIGLLGALKSLAPDGSVAERFIVSPAVLLQDYLGLTHGSLLQFAVVSMVVFTAVAVLVSLIIVVTAAIISKIRLKKRIARVEQLGQRAHATPADLRKVSSERLHVMVWRCVGFVREMATWFVFVVALTAMLDLRDSAGGSGLGWAMTFVVVLGIPLALVLLIPRAYRLRTSVTSRFLHSMYSAFGRYRGRQRLFDVYTLMYRVLTALLLVSLADKPIMQVFMLFCVQVVYFTMFFTVKPLVNSVLSTVLTAVNGVRTLVLGLQLLMVPGVLTTDAGLLTTLSGFVVALHSLMVIAMLFMAFVKLARLALLLLPCFAARRRAQREQQRKLRSHPMSRESKLAKMKGADTPVTVSNPFFETPTPEKEPESAQTEPAVDHVGDNPLFQLSSAGAASADATPPAAEVEDNMAALKESFAPRMRHNLAGGIKSRRFTMKKKMTFDQLQVGDSTKPDNALGARAQSALLTLNEPAPTANPASAAAPATSHQPGGAASSTPLFEPPKDDAPLHMANPMLQVTRR